MKEKVKCQKCGLNIDSDMETCPYCGFKQDKEKKSEENTSNSNINNNVKPKDQVQKQGRFARFFTYESNLISLPLYQEIIIFLFGWIGLKIISTILSLILQNTVPYFLMSLNDNALINFGLYLVLFGGLVLILNKKFQFIYLPFKNRKTWLNGLLGFAILYVCSIAVSIITQIISGLANFTVTSNANQVSLTQIAELYPIASLFIFGFIGPICEEITYRVGLFTLLRKKSKTFAYIIGAILFGLIHFNFEVFSGGSRADIANEFLNMPSYILSGLVLCFIYDKYGVGASITTHVLNNVISLIQIFIYSLI